jgi:F420-dependent oxidoreductase-like protein
MRAMLISAKLAPLFAYADLERFWRDADECGFYAVWNYDHFYGLGAQASDHEHDTLEGWTTLAAMAAIIKRARIGCMVTGVTYRHPAVLANMAATIDHISGGRLELGMGAAWHEAEHAAYGIPFPRAGVRIEMLDEALTVMRKLFTEDRANFDGKHFTLKDAMCNPKPVQRPHPPFVVGGTQPKMLRLIARHADEWNAVSFDAPSWITQNNQLDQACAEVGRAPRDIRRGVQLFLHPAQEGQVEETLARLPQYEAAGAEHVVLSFYQPPSRQLLEKVAPK